MVKNLLLGRISITWKITGMVVAVIVVFACSAITIVCQFVARALHEQTDQRAVAIAHITSGRELLFRLFDS